MRVSLDPDNQLDLSARKYLAARLLRLTRTVRLERELERRDGPGVGEGAHADDGTATAILLAGLSDLMDNVITRCCNEEQSAGEKVSLIEFLDQVQIGLENACEHFGLSSEAFKRVDIDTGAATDDEASRDIDLFDCRHCGRAEWACNGGIVDRDMFADPTGGLCLSFLKNLVETFVVAAEDCYTQIVGKGRTTAAVPPIKLETYRANGSSGTLPIDGEFEQPDVTPQATMRIHWPIPGPLDSAIKSLPYLVFHEVFVHGVQGAELAGPRFRVLDNCAFTEGAVDAVACDLLLDRVLPMPDVLPRLLEPLYSELEEACRAYHEKRFKKEENSKTTLLEPGDKIRDARYRGRKFIYNPLKQMREQAKRDPSWSQQIILMLNLYLDQDQRRQIFKLFNRLSTSKTLRLAMADKLDNFLKTADTHRLLDDFRALLTNDANAPKSN